ncbi:hypothetical protein A3A76_05520 [Candidatus Woesebacteria bacterium RIFCSPLOWO2_01_FULL_39_23]|uniref:DNA-binding response regulator n=1 Tax=Candidatus Woesebacteria bacterium RIFCSPHIGHO2_01_FULL_40_22 TaxID=1802499 RepID=A0A1F7YKN4_9BACT|nr:MAG: hypothetical protein A2141_03790 [Candidatus Woesebacteria bacterium RBG_16_40_11]OGM27914.1 MAG: hypothetical protein A2628_03445 [Candidatus Woesebacteria bacterium RIFCSPHIGHO2_01_FULL_40_22]OGM37076.1 MAG: hypothetical protein A3E41_00720 [Candidatus Woesebacteria bacterium RIFCSPHIGHO2_12_FULL_38_9]OGM61670.1 MAG: hypothetical protein A3A76_05520 [Candidatus Woesebacteria bacterium RIFCSPLOWO2_01_FULL_39_23]
MINSILIIEDDEGIRAYLREILTDHMYSVSATGDGISGLRLVEKIQPDLVLLDLILPDIEGEEVCRRIKKLLPDTVVIILTAKDKTQDIVHGLDLGADDYVSKPFTSEELLARIKTRLRGKMIANPTVKVEDLVLNQKTMEVQKGGRDIILTPQEFKLLEYLMLNKNTVLTRENILNKVWKYSPEIESRVVDVYVGYLRKKIDKGMNDKIIHSVRGFGYIIKETK